MRQPPRVINGAPASEIGNCHTGPVEDEYRVSASATPLTLADIDRRRPDLALADKMAYFEADANREATGCPFRMATPAQCQG